MLMYNVESNVDFYVFNHIQEGTNSLCETCFEGSVITFIFKQIHIINMQSLTEFVCHTLLKYFFLIKDNFYTSFLNMIELIINPCNTKNII